MGNRFNKIKDQVTPSIINAGKKSGSSVPESYLTYQQEQENKGVTESKNIEVAVEKDKKLKRSFMLTATQIQMLSTLKLEHFIATTKEIDLSEIVGISIEDYYLKTRK